MQAVKFDEMEEADLVKDEASKESARYPATSAAQEESAALGGNDNTPSVKAPAAGEHREVDAGSRSVHRYLASAHARIRMINLQRSGIIASPTFDACFCHLCLAERVAVRMAIHQAYVLFAFADRLIPRRTLRSGCHPQHRPRSRFRRGRVSQALHIKTETTFA